ncbi:MAG: hypothetical protein CMN76_05470 [Spirochaetaceae bacterium]|nr:hypothetical protein [Spirochaetaceae bacterium]|tara:strand:- start:118234 stop:119793 length:1560 start_codon:yes stop_codon:yes gene_type:complete
MPYNNFHLEAGLTLPELQKGDTLIIPVFQREDSKENSEPTGDQIATKKDALARLELPDRFLQMLGEARPLFLEEVDRLGYGGAYKKSLLFSHWPLNFARLILAGMGKRTASNPSRLMQSMQSALGSLQADADRIIVDASNWHGKEDSAVIATSAAVSYHLYRSREYSKDLPTVNSVYVAGIQPGPEAPGAVALATAMNQAAARAKDLVNMPPNTKRTATLAEEARSLAGNNLEVSVVEDLHWIEKNMPCFFTVARASLDYDPPRWIHLKLSNPSAKKRIALVGKSVIFDTGGIQVKPGNYMNTMKADMTGGATVLGIIDAMRSLALPHLEIHAFLAATPNLVSEGAMLPDSIVDTTCGKKVEIRHTDAEGRLTLIDAVSMAEKTEPDLMITVATLTGSASRAVGPHTALMSLHHDQRDRLARAGEMAADYCQTLDILEEDFEDIASKLDGADINNTGHESYRGAQTAAAFVLSGLSKEIPLLHLDIAGGDMTKDDKATGIACRAIIQYLTEMNRELESE